MYSIKYIATYNVGIDVGTSHKSNQPIRNLATTFNKESTSLGYCKPKISVFKGIDKVECKDFYKDYRYKYYRYNTCKVHVYIHVSSVSKLIVVILCKHNKYINKT